MATHGHPAAGEGIRTKVFPFPPLPGATSDGLPIPVACNLVAYDSRKYQRDGYGTEGGTFT